MSALPHVAVFDAGSPPALMFVRSLGRRGVPVHVYSHERWPAARLSRYATSFSTCPDVADADVFARWLEGEMRGGRIRLVAPTSDLLAFYLAELEAERFNPALPGRDGTLDALLKDRFARACAALGVRTPLTLTPRSLDEAWSAAPTISYPAILKPRAHFGVGPSRGVVVRDPGELRARYAPWQVVPSQRRIVARMPELRWPIVQEYVPGALGNLYSVSGLIDLDGRVRAAAASRKILQWPPVLGIGTAFEPCKDQALIAQGGRTAASILGRGLFELELIRDMREGQWVAIDLNPRAYGQMRFEIARGLDLPRLWYHAATGELQPREPAPPHRDDLIWTHALPFHVGRVLNVMRGPARTEAFYDYVRFLSRRRVDVVNDLRDPLPSLVFCSQMLRHPGGLVRPFLEAT